MLTTIFIIILAIVVVRAAWPLLADIFNVVFTALSFPFAMVGGILAFLFEALVLLGGLWLLVSLFGA
jgi:hypothetical protein